MKKYLKEFFLILIGALIGLFVEVVFESPFRKLIFPDNMVNVELVCKDKVTMDPISGLSVLVINTGEYQSDAKGVISLRINQTEKEEISIVIEDPKGIYKDINKNFEVNPNKLQVTVWLDKIQY